MVGGNGRKRTLPLVARYADIWNCVIANVEVFNTCSTLLDDLLLAVGRQPRDVKRTVTVPALCWRNAAELEDRLYWLRQAMPGLVMPTEALLELLRTQFMAMLGSPESVIEQMRAYASAGAEELIILWFSPGDLEGLALLAEHVESEELYTVCHQLGFDLFQGYFFAKPLPTPSKQVASQRLHVMQLLNQTMNHAEIAQIEHGFKRDPVLSYKLLRYINSPATGLLQPVHTIAHALVVLGYDQLYRWLTLLLFASGQPNHRTLALMNSALVRARLTELLGRKKLKPQDHEGLFITGIFSLLDALLNMRMEAALESLKLSAPVAAALLRREGIYAPFLDLAIACEEAEAQVIATYAATSGISAAEINIAHLEALIWADEVDFGKA